MHWIWDFGQDLAYAIRLLCGNPTFTATAVLALAAGVGASTAIFSVADGVVLRPLPYKDAGRLLLASGVYSSPDVADLRERATSVFDDVSALVVYRAIVPREDGTAERISKAQISTGFLA